MSSLEDALLEPDEQDDEPKKKKEKQAAAPVAEKETADPTVRDLLTQMSDDNVGDVEDYESGQKDAYDAIKQRRATAQNNCEWCEAAVTRIQSLLEGERDGSAYLKGMVDAYEEYRSRFQ